MVRASTTPVSRRRWGNPDLPDRNSAHFKLNSLRARMQRLLVDAAHAFTGLSSNPNASTVAAGAVCIRITKRTLPLHYSHKICSRTCTILLKRIKPLTPQLQEFIRVQNPYCRIFLFFFSLMLFLQLRYYVESLLVKHVTKTVEISNIADVSSCFGFPVRITLMYNLLN